MKIMKTKPLYPHNKKIYSINVADVQEVAQEELGRKLTQEEIKLVDDRLGDYIGWYDAISMAIQAAGIIGEEDMDGFEDED